MQYKVNYYGFVYLWFDTKRKRFIIGSHHGAIDDGYTTSSGGIYVKRIFNVRPETMKRRIIQYNTVSDDYKVTQQLEQYWLNLRPNIINNVKYYNCKNYVRGGFDRSVKRTKPLSWRIQHAARQRVLVQNGLHNFSSDNATKWANNRIKDGSHHFLHSNFNKKSFRLYKNNNLVGTFESKIAAVKVGWPAHIIDKLRKHGTHITIKGSQQHVIQKYNPGDTFTYENIS